MKVVIIGGVAGGASTAGRLRRNSEEAEIIIFERGRDVSYANCGLPYYLGGVITERAKLVLTTKEELAQQMRITIHEESEVVSINRAGKYVTVKDSKSSRIFNESYTHLVLSPGGFPVKPVLPGANDRRIFTVRSLEDADVIKKFIDGSKPKEAVVVGAGFIGLEMAENLHNLGLKVSIVEFAGQVMNLLDYEMASFIQNHLQAKRIRLFLNDGVKEFRDMGDSLQVVLASGRTLPAEIAVLAMGVKPETGLAASAGLKAGKSGGIKVDRYLRTSDPAIYALGDAAEITDLVSGQGTLIPLANSAQKQGRIVADNICGAKEYYKGTPGTLIVKIFDLAAAMTGNNEKQLKKQKRDFSRVFLSPYQHAEYYPDARTLKIKLLYENKTGLILGAQIIGREGVDKRIDVISAMIQQQKTVFELAELELAYAPPYSSAKDPANLAGMIAVNQIRDKNRIAAWDQVAELQSENALFIDVREAGEFARGHIPGAVNIPFSEIRRRLAEIPRERKVVLYCYQGKTAYFTLRLLMLSGYENVVNLQGGYTLYEATHRKQENTVDFQKDSRQRLLGFL